MQGFLLLLQMEHIEPLGYKRLKYFTSGSNEGAFFCVRSLDLDFAVGAPGFAVCSGYSGGSFHSYLPYFCIRVSFCLFFILVFRLCVVTLNPRVI